MFSKKSAFGIAGATIAAIATLGLAAPAFATESTHRSSDNHATSSTEASLARDVTPEGIVLRAISVQPSVSTGDIGSGNGSGNSVGTTTPILSGDDGSTVASNNDPSTTVLSGNSTDTGNGATSHLGGGNSQSVSRSVNQTVQQTTGNIGTTVGNSLGGLGGGWH